MLRFDPSIDYGQSMCQKARANAEECHTKQRFLPRDDGEEGMKQADGIEGNCDAQENEAHGNELAKTKFIRSDDASKNDFDYSFQLSIPQGTWLSKAF